MRKISKRQTSKAASESDISSDDESLSKHKKSENVAGKKDGANESDDAENKNGEDDDKKSKSRQNEKKSNDDKKKKKKQNVDESNDEGSNSDEETLKKVSKTNKKSELSSLKGKEKEKEQADEQEEPDEDQVEEEEYEVDEVISHKKSHGKLLYLIRWKGYGPDGDTWEKVSTLDNCPDILKKYTDEHPDSLPTLPKKRSKSDKKEKSHKKIKQSAGEEIDENADYEVERILDVFFKKDKNREFLIRWKGYGAASDSWEPEEQLNCPDIIEKFMAKVDRAKNLPEKELRQNRTHTQRFTLMGQSNDRRLSKRHGGKQRAVYYDAEL